MMKKSTEDIIDLLKENTTTRQAGLGWLFLLTVTSLETCNDANMTYCYSKRKPSLLGPFWNKALCIGRAVTTAPLLYALLAISTIVFFSKLFK